MATEFKRLKATITADDSDFQSKLKAADRSSDAFASRLTSLGSKMTLGITTPLVGIGIAAVRSAASYEQSMNIFQATSQATAAQMDAAKQKAKELGADLTLPAVSAADAGVAMTELAKAGLSVEESMAAAKGTLALAAAGELDLKDAVTITTDALLGFNLKGKEATQIADMFAAAANATKAEVKDLGMGFSQASASFSQAGFSAKDLTTALALMANNGIKASDAGTSLKTMVARLLPTTKQATAAFDSIGFSAFDASGKMRPLREIIGELQTKLAGMSQKQKMDFVNTVFGSDASRAASILFLKEGAAGFDKISTAIGKSGAAGEMSNARMKGLSGAWEGLKSTLETLGIALAERFLPPLTAAVNWFSQMASRLSTVNPVLLNVGLAIGVVAAAAGPLLLIISQLVTAFTVVSGAVTAIAGVLSGPVLAVIAVIVAAVAALVLAWKTNFLGIRDFTMNLITSVVQFFQKNWPLIKAVVIAVVQEISAAWKQFVASLVTTYQTFIAPLVALVGEAFQTIAAVVVPIVQQIAADVVAGFRAMIEWWNANSAPFVKFASDTFLLIKTFVTNYVTGLVTAVRALLDGFLAFWKAHGEGIKQTILNAWELIKSIVVGIAGTTFNLIKAILQVFQGDWRGAWESIKQAAKSAWDGIVNSLLALGNMLLSAIKTAFGALASLHKWIFDQALALGKAVIDGIVSAISGGAGRLKEIAVNAVVGMYSAAKGALGISSPSKLFYEIGENVGQGLILGLQSTTPEVRRVSTALALTVLNGFALGLSPEQISNVTSENLLSGMKMAVAKLQSALPPILTQAQKEFNAGWEKVMREAKGMMIPWSPEKGRQNIRDLIKKYEAEFARAPINLKNEQANLELMFEGVNAQSQLQMQIDRLNEQWDKLTEDALKLDIKPDFNPPSFGEAMSQAMSAASEAMGSGLDTLRAQQQEILQISKEAAVSVVDATIEAILGNSERASDILKQQSENFLRQILQKLINGKGQIEKWMNQVLGWLGGKTGNFWGLGNEMGGALITAFASGIVQKGDSVTKALQAVMAKAFGIQLNSTGNIIGAILGGIAGSLIPGVGWILGGSIGSFFGGLFAEGGRPPMGKVSVVGERGPELFVPDTPGTILPNSALALGGSQIVIPVYLGNRLLDTLIVEANERNRRRGRT